MCVCVCVCVCDMVVARRRCWGGKVEGGSRHGARVAGRGAEQAEELHGRESPVLVRRSVDIVCVELVPRVLRLGATASGRWCGSVRVRGRVNLPPDPPTPHTNTHHDPDPDPDYDDNDDDNDDDHHHAPTPSLRPRGDFGRQGRLLTQPRVRAVQYRVRRKRARWQVVDVGKDVGKDVGEDVARALRKKRQHDAACRAPKQSQEQSP